MLLLEENWFHKWMCILIIGEFQLQYLVKPTFVQE